MSQDEVTIGAVGALSHTDFGSYDSAHTYAGASPAAVVAPTVKSGAVQALDTSPQTHAAPITAENFQDVINRANINLASENRVLDFRIDPQTGLSIAMIRNSQTGVVLQQIPGTDIIHLAQMLAGWAPGKNILLDLLA